MSQDIHLLELPEGTSLVDCKRLESIETDAGSRMYYLVALQTTLSPLSKEERLNDAAFQDFSKSLTISEIMGLKYLSLSEIMPVLLSACREEFSKSGVRSISILDGRGFPSSQPSILPSSTEGRWGRSTVEETTRIR